MSENTHHLKMPYIMPAQAQKHVTHNEALRMLDAVTHLSVIAAGLNDAPTEPLEGDRYIIGSSPNIPWDGRINFVAEFIDGAWMYFEPRAGWLAWDQSSGQLMVFNNSAWEATSNDGQIDLLGVNGTATDLERLVVQSQSVLFNHDGSDHRLKLNKAAETDNVSLIFQTGYSGRAEFGLAGEDHFSIKVSADGSAWKEALKISKENGDVDFPASKVQLSNDLFSNLLPDSGRFNSPSNQHQLTSSTPDPSGYVTAFNGATLTYPHKFIHNNSTFGGSSAALDPVVEDLITKIFGPSGLRYGPEFWCMKIDAGTGTSSAVTIDTEQYYRNTIVTANPRPATYTTGFFVKADAGKVAVRMPTGQVSRLLRDGVDAVHNSSDVVVIPADGWVYFEMQITRASLSYDQNDMAIMMTAGSQGHFALPRIVAGHVEIGSDYAVVTNDRVFG